MSSVTLVHPAEAVVHPAEAVGRNEMPFGRGTHVVSLKYHSVTQGPRSSAGGKIWGPEPPVTAILHIAKLLWPLWFAKLIKLEVSWKHFSLRLSDYSERFA